ncbi:MAG: alpha/beta fold hydrolase [Novosphingobium sp.]
MEWRRFTVPVDRGAISGEIRAGARADLPPLCFLHGMAGSRGDWDRLIAHLPDDRTIVRHDLRGFGESTAVEGAPFSHADDLLAMLDALDLDRITPVGLSMGGAVVLNFALAHPHRVSRLVLVSPAMVGWEWSAEWRAQWRAVATAARAGDMALARERWLAHPMFDHVMRGPLADELAHEVASFQGRQWVRSDERPELPDIDRLSMLAMPTLLLTGAGDVPDMRLIADVIAASAADVKRIDYADTGHMVHLERAAEAASAIAAFA